MAIFNSFLYVYQSVPPQQLHGFSEFLPQSGSEPQVNCSAIDLAWGEPCSCPINGLDVSWRFGREW